jgi:error-prone DNA polymerase
MTAKAVKAILSERARREFDSLDDFIVRTGVSRSIVNNLISIGAFESIERKGLLNLSITDRDRLRYALTEKTMPLFVYDAPGPVQDKALCRTAGESAVLVEWELLSFSISAHPLDFHNFDKGFIRIKDVRFAATGSTVKIVGSVIRYQTPPTRNGNRVVYVIMEDGTGVADVTVFGDVQEKCGHVLFRVGWLIVKGKVQRRGPKAVSIIAEYLYPLSLKR